MDERLTHAGTPELLHLRGISAGYAARRIITDIDLTLGRGDILGLLGANGAGKSTLLKAVTGQIQLWTGSVAIDGIDMARAPEQAKAAFGLAVDAPDLPTALSGRQYLELVASIRSCAADHWPCGDVVQCLGLSRWLDRPIADYSVGTRARVSIAAALLGAPPLLIFDELLNGLDPVAVWEVKRMIADLAATGRHAIILSTHIVQTVPGLCNRAMFLANGRIVETWDARQLAASSPTPGAFEACVMQALKAYASLDAAA
ncbi:MAG TPA: ABC transporter ATP-binding protein [Acetobacteraceae bacterium]|jgi:ABC-2 type transport system ATP-binding protein|nr:ABC transporter ATP-binding protein [Acetobacteraceae bacterium]HTC11258.1 ABC transporter ATP-binding protein [Acetobacteraceae bacterium]